MATKKKTTRKPKREMSEDRFTAQASNIQNVRWAAGYGPKAKKTKRKGK